MQFILLFLFLASCQGADEAFLPWEEIPGRVGAPTYRAQVPNGWKRKEIGISSDTKQPLAEFEVDGVRVVIHNFPNMDSIPAGAQVARWKRQFDQLDPTETITRPEAWGGYAGLGFEGIGIQKEKRVGVLAWAMQLAQEHVRALQGIEGTEDQRADYTIKAIGPADAIALHRKEITRFARSFELIQEVPKSR